MEKNFLLNLITGLSMLKVPLNKLYDYLVPGVTLVLEDPLMIKFLLQLLCKADIAVEIKKLNFLSEKPLNFQMGIHVYRKTDSEAEVLDFLNADAYLPVLLVESVAPEYLDNQGFIFYCNDIITKESVKHVDELGEWIPNHINLITSVIEQNATSKYFDVEDDVNRILFPTMLAVGNVLKTYLRINVLDEARAEEWMDEYVQWALKELANAERITGRYRISEVFRQKVFQHLVLHPETECILVDDAGSVSRDETDRLIFFDEEFYYITENLFRTIVESLAKGISVKQLKTELYEEGTLVCNETEKRNFTVKKLIMLMDGSASRVRFLRFQKDILMADNGLYIEEIF